MRKGSDHKQYLGSNKREEAAHRAEGSLRNLVHKPIIAEYDNQKTKTTESRILLMLLAAPLIFFLGYVTGAAIDERKNRRDKRER